MSKTKLIAICGGSGELKALLQQIVSGYDEQNYVVKDVAELPVVPEELEPAVLVGPSDFKYAPLFEAHVVDYGQFVKRTFRQGRVFTYSSENGYADFVARKTTLSVSKKDALEIISNGIIGRVRWEGWKDEDVLPALAAATAAVACGIPFARVLDALNHISMRS